MKRIESIDAEIACLHERLSRKTLRSLRSLPASDILQSMWECGRPHARRTLSSLMTASASLNYPAPLLFNPSRGRNSTCNRASAPVYLLKLGAGRVNTELGVGRGSTLQHLKTSRKRFCPLLRATDGEWMLLARPSGCYYRPTPRLLARRELVQEGVRSEANFHSRLSQEQHARTLTSSKNLFGGKTFRR